MDNLGAEILLVEDDAALVGVLVPVLVAAGYVVTVAMSLSAARTEIAAAPPRLILLDLGLPDGDGKTLIAPALAAGVNVIIISARHQEEEKIASLDAGADDYVDKPFAIGILMARMRAALRRGAGPLLRYYENGLLQVDLAAHRVLLGGEPVRLSPKEWLLLQPLIRSAGQVVTHKRLLTAGWGTPHTDAQYLRVYIGLLRQKLEEDPSAPTIVLTEPGTGYRLAMPEA